MSYSQYNEEPAILEACKGISGGRFLDIGAWHPTVFSNTRALFELGWNGVMVEPSPNAMLDLLKEYGNEPRVQLVCAAVNTIAPWLAEMHITADALSTLNVDHYERWKGEGGYFGKMLIPVVTPEQLVTRFGFFDFVNFDAEGISADLFMHALDRGWAPRCMCVEHDNRLPEISERATSNGYVMTMANGTNAVFVK